MDALNYAIPEALMSSVEECSDDEDEARCCMICSQYTMDDTNSTQLKCGHRFHTACVTEAYKKQESTKVKQCQYCRAPFKFLPYCGGTPVKGLHDPQLVEAFLDQYHMVQPTWTALVPHSSPLFVISGKYQFKKGVFRSCTAKMVMLDLEDGGQTVRTTKSNVLLITAAPATE